MTRRLSFMLVALCWASMTSIEAQNRVDTPSPFTKQALLRALPAATGVQVDPRTDWARILELRPSTEIFLTTPTARYTRCRLLSADVASVTVEDLEAPGQPTVRVPRDEVTQVNRWAGRGGSVTGAIIGAGGGFLAGFLSASLLAYSECSGGCGGTSFLMGVSLVGMPVAGAVLGYHLPGGNREFRTIYLKR